MRNAIVIITLALILALGTIWLHAQSPANLSLSTPSRVPSVMAVNMATTVTLTIPIPSSAVIPTGVNLVRLNGPGKSSTILGQFHDDGQNGDIVAGDKVYTIRSVFNEPTPTAVQLEVSAAVRGTPNRSLSPVITIMATANGMVVLPPDPGSAGMATLAGIDSDHDGVRDDVQRYIALTYAGSAKMQSALTQVAKAQLTMIDDATNTTLSQVHVMELGYGLECLSASGATDVNTVLTSIENQVLNTSARLKAYLQAEGQSSGPFPYRLASDPQSRCLIPPATFPN